MAMQQLTLPGAIVKKDNELVRSKINIDSVPGGRILASLVACIRHDDTQFQDVYRVRIKDFLPDDGRSYQNIKHVCRDLLRATVEMEIRKKLTAPDGQWFEPVDPPAFVGFTFFSQISYRKGMVEARFNPFLRFFLLGLQKVFTEYNLYEYLLLPSSYSQRMFEILKSWSNAPETTLEVAKLHEMLNTPASFRKDFREFRRWVMEKAHKDITAHTTLRYEWQPIKTGRSIEKIRFIFAPGRKTVAEASAKKADQSKQSRLSNKRALKAYNCAMGKDGKCARQDNKPIICKTCVTMDYCQDILRNGGRAPAAAMPEAVQQVLGNPDDMS